MPVEVDCIETGIYRASWIGVVNIQEPMKQMGHMMAMATANQEKHYVMIVDLTRVTQIPFDLNNLSRIAKQDSRVIAFVVIRAPKVAEVMGKMIHQVSRLPFYFAPSLEEGVDTSRALLHKALQQ